MNQVPGPSPVSPTTENPVTDQTGEGSLTAPDRRASFCGIGGGGSTGVIYSDKPQPGWQTIEFPHAGALNAVWPQGAIWAAGPLFQA